MSTDLPQVFYADDPEPGPDVECLEDEDLDIWHPHGGKWHGLFPGHAVTWQGLKDIANLPLVQREPLSDWTPHPERAS